jgi:hypothetical protein
MPNTMNFTWFLALLGAGLLFSILAFTLFLPIIILAPSKFAICFTIGSALIMSAFVSLRGWTGQLAHMFSAERLPFTAGELGLSPGVLAESLRTHIQFSQHLQAWCRQSATSQGRMQTLRQHSVSSAGYLGSMGGTLYAAMGMHSYILTIVCCGAQVSFLPTSLNFRCQIQSTVNSAAFQVSLHAW